MTDKYNLQRFISAQENVYKTAVKELNNGKKVSHWMWFIFPQIEGLGKSATAKEYAIKSLAEAEAYLDHPVLGQRLLTCTQSVIDIENRTAEDIFGYPDTLKFQSCMTLFSLIGGKEDIFKLALSKYYEGQADDSTLRILAL